MIELDVLNKEYAFLGLMINNQSIEDIFLIMLIDISLDMMGLFDLFTFFNS